MKTIPERMVMACLCMALVLCAARISQAADIVTVTSEKTAVVDRVKGTAVWEKNVHVVRRSDGSNLLSDLLTIVRNPATGRVIRAEAKGNVRGEYYKVEDRVRDAQPEPNANPRPPHTRISCDAIRFNRNTNLGTLSGDVQVLSREFEIRAEYVRYNYRQERGKITAKPDGQVAFVFYGKADPEKQTAGKKVTGVADEILFDRPSGKAVLQGKVDVVDHSDQSRFRADRADLFFNKQEEIETIVADGHFSMNQPRRFSRADRAVFEYGTEEVTLIGNAYVKDDTNNMEISSARIKMYMKVDKGIVSGVNDVPVKMNIKIK